MYAGISGLRNHQVKMDVIGNNIANVNTIGFKKSRVSFQDILSQTIKSASAPTDRRGGTNGQQAGLGMTVGGINAIHSPGSLQATGKMTDLSIEGDGFFVLKSGEQTFFSRAGDFSFDRNGYLLNASGFKVQGFLPVEDPLTGVTRIDHLNPLTIEDVKINVGEGSGAKASENISVVNNLDSQTSLGTTIIAPIEIYDENGRAYQAQISFSRSDIADWSYTITVRDEFGNAIEEVEENTGQLLFTNAGKLDLENSAIQTFSFTDLGGGIVAIDLDFSKTTQYSSPSSVQADFQDGYPSGTLESVVIDGAGIITGVYSNGKTKDLAKVATAIFKNPAGLAATGGNLYVTSNNSGLPDIGASGLGGRGNISAGTLEMSNVDLSEEFVDMISTQRGFQANSRIITTSDEMLQELINMKR
jgi:flagellar hook protein FlgE